ncbi:hypothetical protein BH10BAC5_BH10BAC5_05970 [soil metagenome]
MTENKTQTETQEATNEVPQAETKTADIIPMKDFTALITEKVESALKEMTDKIDRKHFKLPDFEDHSESENNFSHPVSEKQSKNIKFKKFLRGVFTKNINLEGISADGGYLVPIEFEAQVVKLLIDHGVFRRNCTVAGMNSKTLTKPRLLTGVSATFTSEASEGGQSNPTFEQITWTRKKLDVTTGLSRELIEDSGVDIMSELSQIVANAMAQKEDEQGFKGNGSPITGVFNASGVQSIVLSGANPNTLTYSKLAGVITAIRSVGLKDAKWYMHRSILGLILNLTDGSGTQIFDPAVFLATKNLLGYPVELSEELNDSSSVSGKPVIFFGNLKHSVLRERKGLYMRMSDTASVGGASAFEQDLIYVKTSESFDIQHEITDVYCKVITG